MKCRFIVLVFALALSNCKASGTSVLLFAGAGTSPNDVAAIARLLDESRISYSTATSAELDEG